MAQTINQQPQKKGVIIVNIGAPHELSIKSIRHYLKLFLSDTRVIELTPFLWQPILRMLVLPFRPRKSIQKYQLIWGENHLSPLHNNTVELVAKIQEQLDQQSSQNEYLVTMAMNYSPPFIDKVIAKLQSLNINHLVIIPIFPQYSATTVAASLDKVWQYLATIKFQPEISSVNYFYDNPLYIEALCESILNYWHNNTRSELLILSYHGIPLKYVQQGDPYFEHCKQTTLAVQKKLNLNNNQIMMGFQSRFGSLKWLGPNTQDLLQSLPKQGIKSVDIASPSFILDCLETLEELDISGREDFLKAGGTQFNYIPCLNHSPKLVELLTSIILSK